MGVRYKRLRTSVREQAVVHTDDTGWRVGRDRAFLMAFVNPALSVYQIRPPHRNKEVRELVPADFGGVMVCDGGRSYDAMEREGVAQQKVPGAPDPQRCQSRGREVWARAAFRPSTHRSVAACAAVVGGQCSHEAPGPLPAGLSGCGYGVNGEIAS